MKKKYVALIAFLGMFLLVMCTADPIDVEIEEETKARTSVNTEPKIVVFGRYYGRCIGNNCVEIYRFDGSNIYEDINEKRPGHDDFFEGNFKHLVELDVRLNLFKLVNELPYEHLTSLRGNIVGDPGAYGQGVYYLEYQDTFIRKFWIIDTDKSNTPKEIHPYTDLLGEMIDIIEQEDTTY